jgi:hypothetical protein
MHRWMSRETAKLKEDIRSGEMQRQFRDFFKE